MKQQKRRMTAVLLATFSVVMGMAYQYYLDTRPTDSGQTLGVTAVQQNTKTSNAVEVLEQLEVKGRAPKTGYGRGKFSNGWGAIDGCSVRELILQRDLSDKAIDTDGCRVLSGVLVDPYAGGSIQFKRGINTSQAVQIDHVVAVSDAWQKGAQQLSSEQRYNLYNDPLNLLAVDGQTNNKKGDGDAATWLPPNKDYRCRYVARQIAVKQKYALWLTATEKSAMKRVLTDCPGQQLPLVEEER